MKSLFEDTPRQEILDRINKLTPQSKPLWGRIDVAQMLAHNIVGLEAALQNKKPARSFMGYIMGGFIKKTLLSPKPFKKNGFTPKEFRMVSPMDFIEQKNKIIDLINKFQKGAIADKNHPFFGEMSEGEWGWLQYKHLDHHLQQFGV